MWYSSKEIREILHISSQYLYLLKKNGKIKTKEISSGKYLYSLPENFNKDLDITDKNELISAVDLLRNAIETNKNISITVNISN